MYKFSNFSAEDFGKIYEYTLLNFGVKQADEYTYEREPFFETLAKTPLMGCEYPEIKTGIRRMDYIQHAIFYRVRDHDILVIRILHHKMEPMIHLIGI